jgi:tetratricopeptide (TPR) repeat protein
LYPYVLAVCFRLVGDSVWIVRVVQAVAGALGVGCLYYGTSRLAGRAAGVVAGIMLAAYAPAIFFDGIVQKTSLGCLLLCSLLAAMACGTNVGVVSGRVMVGVIAGLLVLTRENALVWLPILAVWIGLAGGRLGWTRRLAYVALYAMGVMLVLGPVAVRNRAVGGEWSISTFQAGPNFYIGNHRGADGRYQPLVRGHETPAFERVDATILAEQDRGGELTAGEVSRYWIARAMQDIRADPAWWLGLMGRKMLMVWNHYEVSDAESQYVYERYSLVLRVLASVWHFGVLCPIAAAGIVCTRHQWRRLWVYYALIVSMAAAVALFYVMGRYRFPLVPLLIPFAAIGCVSMWHHVEAYEWRRLTAPVAVALAVGIVVNWPVHEETRLNALAVMNVGVALAEEGDLTGATEQFQQAVEGLPESAEANNNLAQALALQNDYEAAIPHYQAALRAEPDLLGVDYNLAFALERTGRVDEALRHYERALGLDPTDVDARAAIARLQNP